MGQWEPAVCLSLFKVYKLVTTAAWITQVKINNSNTATWCSSVHQRQWTSDGALTQGFVTSEAEILFVFDGPPSSPFIVNFSPGDQPLLFTP